MIMTFIPIMKDDEKKYKSRCVSEYLIILYYITGYRSITYLEEGEDPVVVREGH